MKALSALSLAMAVCLGSGAAANAQSASPPADRSDVPQTTASQQLAHRDTSVNDTQVKGRDQADNGNCLRDTGSLIKAKKGHCLPVHGRSYSREDLLRTGQIDTARALQMLDPSITVHGH